MIYLAQRRDTIVKIGYTANPQQRLATLRSLHGDLKFIGLMEGDKADERAMHRLFSGVRVEREWFRFVPSMLGFGIIEIPEMSDAVNTFRSTLRMIVESQCKQKDFAAAIGISPQYLNDLLAGKRGPNPDLCDRIAGPDERLAAALHKLGARAAGWRV